MDAYWFTELREKGFSRESNLTSFLKQIEEVALIKFPLHQRRMIIFTAKPNGDSLTFYVADWTTFNQEAAACHSVMFEEAKRAWFKILSKTPEGDIKSLITKLQSIEAYPDKEIAVKPVTICEACGTCNYKGHATKDCWGKCQHCQRYGHQSKFCRNKRLMKKLKRQKEQRRTGKLRKKIRKRRGRGKKRRQPWNW